MEENLWKNLNLRKDQQKRKENSVNQKQKNISNVRYHRKLKFLADKADLLNNFPGQQLQIEVHAQETQELKACHNRNNNYLKLKVKTKE